MFAKTILFLFPALLIFRAVAEPLSLFLMLLLLHCLTITIFSDKNWQIAVFFLAKKVCQIIAKLITFWRNVPRKVPWNLLFPNDHFSVKFVLKMSARLHTKSAFFPPTSLWKYSDVWLFPWPTRSPVFLNCWLSIPLVCNLTNQLSCFGLFSEHCIVSFFKHFYSPS